MTFYCVESQAVRPGWLGRLWLRLRRRPIPQEARFCFWTTDRVRAETVASQAPGRRIRVIPEDRAPAQVVENARRAARAAARGRIVG